MRTSRRMLLLGACLSVLSCSLNEPVSEVALAITIGVNNTTVPVGGSIDITVNAQNYGDTPITLIAPPQCLLFFQVHALGGDIVFRSFDECGGNPTTREIPPGEEFSMTLNWDGRGNTGTRVVGGTYLLRVGALLENTAILGGSLTVNVE